MPGDGLPLLLGESAFLPTGPSGYWRRCDAAFWMFAETRRANRLPQPATRKQRVRDQTSSVPRGEDDAVARRRLDPYVVNTRCAVPDVTFAKTKWKCRPRGVTSTQRPSSPLGDDEKQGGSDNVTLEHCLLELFSFNDRATAKPVTNERTNESGNSR